MKELYIFRGFCLSLFVLDLRIVNKRLKSFKNIKHYIIRNKGSMELLKIRVLITLT
jgi:hypothetical protein